MSEQLEESMSIRTLTAACLLICMINVSVSAQEQPPVISAPAGSAPSDAIVLFDGSGLAEWQSLDGSSAKWKIQGGAMVVSNGSGGVITKREFGDVQLHLEFATPEIIVGEGQGRGNSGVYFHGAYEVQVLDSYQNETYTDGMLGAVYEQYPPLMNPARKAGEWQSYDIIFRAPVFSATSTMVKRPRLTVLLNGILIHDNIEVIGPTRASPRSENTATGPIFLQDHGNPVKYRNVWVREL